MLATFETYYVLLPLINALWVSRHYMVIRLHTHIDQQQIADSESNSDNIFCTYYIKL